VRGLAAAGVTHHQLVETERQSRTRILLATSHLPLVEIAEQLGFSDPSSFGRKCRDWFGDSPARVRRRLTAA